MLIPLVRIAAIITYLAGFGIVIMSVSADSWISFLVYLWFGFLAMVIAMVTWVSTAYIHEGEDK